MPDLSRKCELQEDNQPPASGFKPLLCTKREAAAFLGGVCVRTIDNLIGAGALKPVKLLRRTLIRYSDLVALVRKGGFQSRKPV